MKSPDDLIKEAIAHEESGDFEHARESYNRAIALDPQNAVTIGRLGVLHMDRGESDLAVEHFRRVLLIDTSSSVSHFNIGLIYASRQNFREAISSFDNALKTDPHNAHAASALGAMYSAIRENRKAVESYQQALSIDENLPEANLNLAVILIDESNFEEARKLLERATAARSDYLKAWVTLGHVWQSLGDSTAALVSYKKAICAEVQDDEDRELVASAQENIRWLEAGSPIS